MDEILKGINNNIDTMNECLNIFEKDDYINSTKLYIHLNALYLCSELMRIINDISIDILNYDNLLTTNKIKNIQEYVETTLRPDITNNLKNSYINDNFYRNMHKYVKDEYDTHALLIKTELAYFSSYNLVKLIKILTDTKLNDYIETLLKTSINRYYFIRVNNVKNYIDSLVKTIHENIIVNHNDDRFLEDDETYRDKISMMIDVHNNGKHYIPYAINEQSTSNESIGITISFENFNMRNIKDLNKENKEKIVKSLLLQVEDELTLRLNI